MTETDKTVGSFFAFCILATFILLPISAPVVQDHNDKLTWKEFTCKGTRNLKIKSGIEFSRATLTTDYFESETSTNKTGSVELIYPPNRHWFLIGKYQKDAKTWASGLGSTESFACYLNKDRSQGISAHYDEIAMWIAFVVIGALAAFCLLCCGSAACIMLAGRTLSAAG